MTHGELWWADFGLPFGNEAGFRRPVLVVQDDVYTQSRLNTVVVVPLTTNLPLEEAPGNVFPKEESSLAKDSGIVVTQLSAIDTKRLIENISKVTQETMQDVETGITTVLGID